MTTSLKTIIPLALVSSFLLGYQYLGAQWVGPSVGPTGGNVPAPINVGNQDQVKSGGLSIGALSIYGGGLIESAAPTIEFSDTDHRDWWLHANTDRFYFLADRNDDGVWAGESPWPLELYAGPTPAQDVARFSNNVWAAGYCDENGNNCVDSTSVGGGGPLMVQSGEVFRPAAEPLNTSVTVPVTFNTPFSAPPQVLLSVTHYQYTDNCRQDNATVLTNYGNLTSTGMNVQLFGTGTCGGRQTTFRVSWIAIGPS